MGNNRKAVEVIRTCVCFYDRDAFMSISGSFLVYSSVGSVLLFSICQATYALVSFFVLTMCEAIAYSQP